MELLVVVGVIAILTGLLFPIVTSARESARQAVCMSNLKQIYYALQMYLTDYDTSSWKDMIAPRLAAYSASDDVLGCSDRPDPASWGYIYWNIAYLDTDMAYLRRAEERGGSYPIVFCIHHIPHGVIPVLRLDGSVSKRHVPKNCGIGAGQGDGSIWTPDL